MKQFIKIVIAAFVLFAAPTFASAQKVAHINQDSLLKIMPDYQKVKDSLTNYTISIQKTMMGMEMEFERKSRELDSLRKQLSPLMIQLREKELADMQQNYAAFAQAAEQEAMTIQVNLLTPLFKKIDNAIAAVAKEKGYTYVLDSSKGGPVLYSNPADDIFVPVCQKLGVPIPKPATTGGAPAPGANK
jgi:outer membrane protein